MPIVVQFFSSNMGTKVFPAPESKSEMTFTPIGPAGPLRGGALEPSSLVVDCEYACALHVHFARLLCR